MNAFDYAHENAERFRRQLHDLIRIPSISTDPAFAGEVRHAANWLVDHLKQIGLHAERIDTQSHPMVYAEWLNAGDAPTVLIYGHYDVQPAVIEDGWDTDPFEPVEKDGLIYARGSDDDKGQFFTHLKAIESLLATDGKLPVNVRLIIEGEEESGSGAIRQFVAEQPDRLQADVCVISDTGMERIDQPMIINALRGGSVLEIRVSGPRNDLHSGMYGGTVHNPALALAEILSRLHHPGGGVAVPGFYDNVRALTPEDRAEIARVGYTEADWRAATGAPLPWGERNFSLLERIGARPTLEITGMTSGYTGSGFKSIVPAKAVAKIHCRLVADQDPQHVFDIIRDYVMRITPPTVKVEVVSFRGASPALIDSQHPVMQAAARAYERGWGTSPLFMREGGSIPIVTDFQRQLDLPVVLMGFGLNSDGLHGPNEHFPIEAFHRGIDTSIAFLEEMQSSL